MYFSTYTAPSPKAAWASLLAWRTAAARAAASCTMRMPLPPPPADALTMTGRPTVRATSAAASASATTPEEPGVTGTPAAVMVARAMALSPIVSIDSGPGPMKVRSLSAHRREKAALSARKP